MFTPTLALTVNNAEEVLEAGLRAIEAGESEIDLSRLTTVDSAAVATLLAWQRASLSRGRALKFLNPPANLQSLSHMYGVDGLLDPTSATSNLTNAADLQHH